MYNTQRRGWIHFQEYLRRMGKYSLANILGHGGANQSPHITETVTRPGGTIIIRPLTAVLIVVNGGGDGCSGQGHDRGGCSGVRGRGRGQCSECGDNNDLPSKLILQLKQLTRKVLALGGSEVKDSPTSEMEK